MFLWWQRLMNHLWHMIEFTHCGLTPYGDIDVGQHCLRLWLVAWQHQAIIWTNAVVLSIKLLGTYLQGNLIWSSNVFSCDQAAILLVQSVCLSVRPSVRLSVTPFSPCSHHHIIMKLSGVITNDKSDVHAKGQGQRSKVKVTEVNTQLNRFRTVTLVWIHIWCWNDAYSLMMLRRGALLFFKVIRQISRSHGSKKPQIWPRLGVSGL